ILKKAKNIERMKRNDDARRAWNAVYDCFPDGSNLIDSLLARAEAQVLRLSMIYALLDSSAIININHLLAALAVWEYVEESVRYLFKHFSGDTTTDAILAVLKDSNPEGISKTDLHNAMSRNKRAEELDRGLYILEKQRLVKLTYKEGPKKSIDRI